MRARPLLVLLVALLLAVPLAAQTTQDTNAPIPECDPGDFITTSLMLGDFPSNYADFYEHLREATGSDYSDLIAELDQLQWDWWNMYSLALPDCAYAHRLNATIGRLLDETLIAMLYIPQGEDFEDARNIHTTNMQMLRLELIELSDILSEAVDEALGN